MLDKAEGCNRLVLNSLPEWNNYNQQHLQLGDNHQKGLSKVEGWYIAVVLDIDLGCSN